MTRELRSKLLSRSWLLLGITACSERAPPTVTTTDSAGVRVTITTDAPVVFAELDSVPTLSIGGAAATGPTQFFGVQGIHVDPSGRLWVADGQSGEIRIFLPDGTHWKTRGGRGEGPGEFVRIRLLGAGAGDSVLVGDGALGRVTVFDPEGDFVRTVRSATAGRAAPRLFASFDDGSLLGVLPRVVAASSLAPGQILADSLDLIRVSLSPIGFEPYASAPGPLWIWTGATLVPLPFTINASFDVVGNGVHLVTGPDFRIRVIEGGRLREVYGVDREVRPVASSDVESYRAFIEEYVPEQARADHLSALAHDHRPDVLPGYDRLLASADGQVWAQVYEPHRLEPHDWHVFDHERRFVGSVRVGSGFYPMVMGEDAVVGVWRGPLGVEHVRAYRFLRPGA